MLAVPKVVQDSLYSTSGKLNAGSRLLRADGFEHVFKAGNITEKQFKLFFAPNSGKCARLGIVASKRMLPRAVNRNHVKRIIREVFRQHNIKHFRLDLVVMVRRNYPVMANAQIDNLKKLFTQLENRCADL